MGSPEGMFPVQSAHVAVGVGVKVLVGVDVAVEVGVAVSVELGVSNGMRVGVAEVGAGVMGVGV